MSASVVYLDECRQSRRPTPVVTEQPDEYAKRRVREMLSRRVAIGRLSPTVASNAGAEAARRVRMKTPVRIAIEDALAWAARFEREPPPHTPLPAA